MSFPSPVQLETARLVVTMPPPSDGQRMVDYFERNRAHLAPWEPARTPEFYTRRFWSKQLELARDEFTDDRAMRLVVFPRKDPARPVIGVANFTSFIRGAFHACLLGYSLDERYQGQGLMHEALVAAIRFAFDDLHLHRIMANYQPGNHRSAQLLRRLGFEPEGFARDYLHIGGAWRDHILTALTNEGWTPPAG